MPYLYTDTVLSHPICMSLIYLFAYFIYTMLKGPRLHFFSYVINNKNCLPIKTNNLFLACSC